MINYTHKEQTIIKLIEQFGSIGGEHHKQWVIDQILRIILEEAYENWTRDMRRGEDGPETYAAWDEGIAP